MSALATPGDLERHLQREIDPETADQALELASGVVQAFIGWDPVRQDTILFGEGMGSALLYLPTMHLVHVDSITIESAGVTVTLDESSDQYQYPRWTQRGQLWYPPGFPKFSTVAVACTSGYDPVPEVLKLVVLDLAARHYTGAMLAAANPQGLASKQVGQVSLTYRATADNTTTGTVTGLSTLHERLLDRYTIF